MSTRAPARRTHAEPAPTPDRRGARPNAHASAPTLQRQLGNRAYRQAAPGARPHVQRCACGGSCPHCKAKEEAAIQTKLTVGPPGDAYEREAEAVAERVTRMPDGAAQGVGGAASGIQRLAGGEASAGTTDLALPSAGARSLSPQTRAFMEPRFGADFSGVRVHEGREAQSAAQKLEARAFTSGRDIWLGRGAQEGDRRLMAHELTHVVQQSGGGAAGRIQRDPPRPPPPPAPTPTACPGGTKIVTVDMVSLRDATRNPVADLAEANRLFLPCCVQFRLGIGVSARPDLSDTWLGGDTAIEASPSCAASTEEVATFTGARAAFGLSSRIRVFYVNSISGASFDAYSFHAGCGSATTEMAVVSNAAGPRELAHEMGHMLLNAGNSAHRALPNLMADPDPGTVIDPTQCTTIFANA